MLAGGTIIPLDQGRPGRAKQDSRTLDKTPAR